MPPEVIRNVKSTVVPTMGTNPSDANADKQYSRYLRVWQNFIFLHYCGQDTVLAERNTFLDTCKQWLHESVAEFEAHCKCYGLWCEYRRMANPEKARRSWVITKNQGRLSEDNRVHAHGCNRSNTASQLHVKRCYWSWVFGASSFDHSLRVVFVRCSLSSSSSSLELLLTRVLLHW